MKLADFGLAIEVEGDQQAWFGRSLTLLHSCSVTDEDCGDVAVCVCVYRLCRDSWLPLSRGSEEGSIRESC